MRHGSAAQEYTMWMEDMYGRDFVKDMIAKKSSPVKKIQGRLRAVLLAGFNELIREHERRIC